ncbi:ribonuclease III domain-containing protein [Persicirhabdus sediminis]|uniref:RNase III domain-containing protein n=1 Tax=Persicirhabdus sediminis TaxID=454144 RepID=A0A8J7MEW6_9BACT|nr:ribonuclease III domain-containing protein [Persicirhabdus sediminis]MBK1791401.1 hypothetical protein [Persicirhabdus sediminis]
MSAPKKQDPELTKEREEAWIGDGVLAIYVREYILREFNKLDGEMFVRFTSNDFLRVKGNPTSVEAEIGRIYKADGLQAGFDWIETNLLPIFIMQEKNYQKKQSMKRGRKG